MSETDASTGTPNDARTRAEERHESLEAERDFLLRSLDDLDSELLAGNIDPDTYRVLHDDYTARASAVIQSIADGVERRAPSGPRAPLRLRALTIGGIVVFAILAAFLLAHAVGQRSPNGEITGDSQSSGASNGLGTTVPATDLASAQKAAAAQPKSYDAQIVYARALLTAGSPSAIQQYLVASRLDPTQAEPFAYAGYLTAEVIPLSQPADQKTLIPAAAGYLQQAITVDPTYPDSYAFKGFLLTQIEKKQCPGALAFEQFLAIAPGDHPLRPQVLTALSQAMTAGKCPQPKSIPPTTTKP